MKSRVLFIFLVVFSLGLQAQSPRKARRDSMIRVHNRQDTNYVRKYLDRLIISLNQSYRHYDVQFSQKVHPDTSGISSHQYIADANVVTGAAIDFDKISFSFSLKSVSPTDAVVQKKGKTSYSSFSLSFNAFRFRVETSYRNYKNFYDLNSARYISPFTDSVPYYQSPMDVRSLRAKTLFIFNKKRFSYNAAYYNTYRQIKSAGSWLGVANVYGYRFRSDPSFFPPSSRVFYDTWGYMDYFNVFGISVGPGASYNLVLFKVAYLNLTLTTGLDMQHQYYHTRVYDMSRVMWRAGFASDFRAAFGLNFKNFFTSLTLRIDYNSYLAKNFLIEPRYITGDFNIGYRFPFKQRKWVKKLQENEYYKML
ncbi:MAG: hypothetical protein FD123_4016 [Bacteroidetes bacterium]|nr:MAG: hypothetical protein FD123_4016 [Bacteroidota bacterium]